MADGRTEPLTPSYQGRELSVRSGFFTGSRFPLVGCSTSPSSQAPSDLAANILPLRVVIWRDGSSTEPLRKRPLHHDDPLMLASGNISGVVLGALLLYGMPQSEFFMAYRIQAPPCRSNAVGATASGLFRGGLVLFRSMWLNVSATPPLSPFSRRMSVFSTRAFR